MARFIRLLFSHQILPQKQLDDMLKLIDEKNITLIQEKEGFIDVGQGLGIGLVYVKNVGLQWMHAGGRLGYESLFAYDPCNNIVVTLAYNTRPNSEFVFMKIFQEIQRTLQMFQETHTLPAYCHF